MILQSIIYYQLCIVCIAFYWTFNIVSLDGFFLDHYVRRSLCLWNNPHISRRKELLKEINKFVDDSDIASVVNIISDDESAIYRIDNSEKNYIFSKVIHSLSKSGQWLYCEKLLDVLKSDFAFKPDAYAYSSAMSTCIR